ncbi:tRNA glutamyl-Q(34) synthetase GluQRS [Donghicola sp. XS_ASV15]|uniref:tRNA glutamyl-Q(34) synthetase GluQRS n=1 Tax=Donghicola sp. XS_ASV15 TaxID=3241295 RepID=UPI003510F046
MRTRFAPSPTGPLHLGHAFSALTAAHLAQSLGGEFLLRIEDIDQSRARPEWEAQIYDDLTWLGLSWPTPVMRQSDRMPSYRAALQTLWDMDLLYPCTCKRRDIEAAMSAPQEGVPTHGPDGLIYPGTCRTKPKPAHMPDGETLRLDMAKAVATIGTETLTFTEIGPVHTGTHIVDLSKADQTLGDIVLARRDMGTSYHLSVVIDDADQGITHVTRGSDLFEATQIHVILQALLNKPVPNYHHHDLIRDAQGKRLAKRDDARAIALYRAEGKTPQDIATLTNAPVSFC